MSPKDWSRLAPHRPLGVGDAWHIERPSSNGARLAAMVKARMGPIAVTGPVGCGKSTELAAAARVLHQDFVTVLVPLDRLVDMRQLEDGVMFQQINSCIAQVATSVLDLRLSVDTLNPEQGISWLMRPDAMGRSAFLSLVREVGRKSHQGRVALLVDGLEKCPGEVARHALRSLLAVREEIELVVVVPLELVTGPEGYEILSELKVFPIRPVPVLRDDGVEWRVGRTFLKEIFLRRMELKGVEQELESIVELAANASSGLPRTFLQLLRDAGGYAAIADREWPRGEDLHAAVLDQKESLHRILRDGDLAVLESADGTEGLEVPVERRIRLLTQGLLLEYEINGRVIVHPNQLLFYKGVLSA
jgi:hypothetical protein